MHDLRAAPRWSKTAGIVVLVVFGLVLVVSILGLWVLTGELERQRDDQFAKARADGKQVLDDISTGKKTGDGGTIGITPRITGIIRRASDLHGDLSTGRFEHRANASRDLRNFLEGNRDGRLASWVVRVDGTSEIRWIGGRYRLWMALNALQALADTQKRADHVWGTLSDQAPGIGRRQGALEGLAIWQQLVEVYGLVARPPLDDPGGEVVPFGLGWAKQMVQATANALGEEKDLSAATIRDVLFRAEEALALNAQLGRLPARTYQRCVRDIEHETRRVFMHARKTHADIVDSLLWEVAEYRRIAALLVDDRRGENLRAELVSMRSEAGKNRSRPLQAIPQGEDVYGIYTLNENEALIVAFDAAGVDDLVHAAVKERREDLQALGMTAQVFRSDENPVGPNDEEPAAREDLQGAIELPYRIAIFQTGAPVGVEDEYTSFLFVAVILLAAAGLIVGGYVLVRLLTREMRLAQLKADFVSNLSHELKTPITSISLFTEMLEDGKLTEPEDQAEAYGVMGLEVRRLQRIVTRMIDVARGEARTTPYNLAPGDVNRPVREAVTRFRRITTEDGLDLQAEIHPEPLPIQMDVQALDDVVTNLLSNAWKYKREDRARIVVKTARRGRFAEIVVQDDGIGIPRAERRKVFDMFYRSEQLLTQPVAGTGLGLALVRSVVAGHRGRIQVDAAPGGVGSVFTVRLPMDREAAAQMAQATASSPGVEDIPASDASDAPPHGKVLPS